MFKQKINIFLVFTTLLVLLASCSDKTLAITKSSLPKVSNNRSIQITLFALKNYTDTPRAGMRAANIVEGILNAKGYKVLYNLQNTTSSDRALIAKEEKSQYYMVGAISEWRYKTGIDGEPAVSLRLALYDSNNGKLIWSGTGANNDWGNASIGTTAQSLIEEMLH